MRFGQPDACETALKQTQNASCYPITAKFGRVVTSRLACPEQAFPPLSVSTDLAFAVIRLRLRKPDGAFDHWSRQL